jgi:hypothetical protein
MAEPSAVHAEDGEPFFDLLLPRGLHLCPHCGRGLLRCVHVLERPPPAQRCRRVAA